MKLYAYTMTGTAADGQTWKTRGELGVDPGDFPVLLGVAVQDTFVKLTQGKAVFGQPGVGCRGPYSIEGFTLRATRDKVPGYWMNEVSGELHDAVEALLFNAELKPEHIDLLREYFRQWVGAEGFQGPGIEQLRQMVDGLTTREAVDRWLALALDEGIDPL
jgi:hypothetical protein